MPEVARKNLRIAHMGMNWPVGTVVPPDAFPRGASGHLAIGAVIETDDPPTAGKGVPAAPKPGADLAAENERLRVEIAEQDARLTAAVSDLKAAQVENQKLRAENASLMADLDAATDVVSLKTASDDRRRREDGPSVAEPVPAPVPGPLAIR